VHSKWTFIIAFVAILLSLIGLFNNLSSTKASDLQGSQSLPEKTIVFTQVWRSTTPIKAGKTLSKIHFTSEKLPLTEALQQELKTGPLNFIKASVIGNNMAADELLLNNNIVPPTDANYINLILTPGMTPYPLQLDALAIYGGKITAGDFIDVITLTSKNTNIANNKRISDFADITVAPLLVSRRVLAVYGDAALTDLLPSDKKTVKQTNKSNAAKKSEKTTLILELSRPDAAKMAIAKRIGIIEIYKSVGLAIAEGTRAVTKDVLPELNTITEFRGTETLQQ
jgi:pilus assembly protein CpaB